MATPDGSFPASFACPRDTCPKMMPRMGMKNAQISAAMAAPSASAFGLVDRLDSAAEPAR